MKLVSKQTLMKIVPQVVSRNVGRQILNAKKQSPHIFFVAGIVGVVGTAILASRATLRLSGTLDQIESDLDAAKELKDTNHDDWQLDTVYIYSRAGLQIVRLYGPTIIVGTLSIAALTGSHMQMSRRNTSLMAAYALVAKAYEDYRDRVRETLGEEKELDIYHAVTNSERKGEAGNKELVKQVDPTKWSPYAVFFDEASRHWEKDPELNRIYIQCQETFANHLLRARGHVFLNEVYDMLDVPRTKAGAVVGWVIGDEGDNYVSFGMFDGHNSHFVNGWERSVILDFNVDGVIYDKI